MNERTVRDLDLTRYEKTILVAVLCCVETQIEVTMNSVLYFNVHFVRIVLDNSELVEHFKISSSQLKVEATLNLIEKVWK